MTALSQPPPRRALTTIVLVTLIIPVALLYAYLAFFAIVLSFLVPAFLVPVVVGGWTLYCLLKLWKAVDANDGREVGLVAWVGIVLGIIHTMLWAVVYFRALPWYGVVCVLPVVAVLILFGMYQRAWYFNPH